MYDFFNFFKHIGVKKTNFVGCLVLAACVFSYVIFTQPKSDHGYGYLSLAIAVIALIEGTILFIRLFLGRETGLAKPSFMLMHLQVIAFMVLAYLTYKEWYSEPLNVGWRLGISWRWIVSLIVVMIGLLFTFNGDAMDRMHELEKERAKSKQKDRV